MLTLEECRLQLVVNSDSVMWSGSCGRRGGGIAPKSTSESIASIVTGSLRRGDWQGCAEASQCVDWYRSPTHDDRSESIGRAVLGGWRCGGRERTSAKPIWKKRGTNPIGKTA